MAVGKPRSRPRFSPVDDLALDEIGASEQAVGERHVAALQGLARRGGGDGVETAGLVLDDPLDDLDPKAKPSALGPQKIGVALARGAKAEIIAGHDRRDAEPPRQYVASEIRRRQRRETTRRK